MKKILIIHTGGTISMKEDDNLISSVKVAGREEARGKGVLGPYSMTKSTQLKT